MKNKIYTYLISNNVQIDQDVFDYGVVKRKLCK